MSFDGNLLSSEQAMEAKIFNIYQQKFDE